MLESREKELRRARVLVGRGEEGRELAQDARVVREEREEGEEGADGLREESISAARRDRRGEKAGRTMLVAPESLSRMARSHMASTSSLLPRIACVKQ